MKKRFNLKTVVSYLSTLCLVSLSSSASAYYNSELQKKPSFTSGGSAKTLPLAAHNSDKAQTTEKLQYLTNKSNTQHIDIASGLLTKGATVSWQHGFSDDNVFSSIAADTINIDTDQSHQYRAKINNWENDSPIPRWSGLHAITRYQCANNLYLASVRYDGKVTIKVKHQGNYTTLAETTLINGAKSYLDQQGHLATGKWYKIKFSAIGSTLTVNLDGIDILTVENDLLSAGSVGIRSDYASTYLDDWQLNTPSLAQVDKVIEAEKTSEQPTIANLSPWDSNLSFTSGDYVQYNDKTYQANWMTKNQNPINHSGKWQAWTEVSNS